MGDLINRHAAIDALWKALYEYEDKTEKQFIESDELDIGDWILHRIFVQNMSDIDRQTILNLPSAQPDLSDYSDKLWRAAFERGKAEGKEERKTGRWKFYGKETWVRDDGKPVFIQCSECNATVINNGSAEWNFCPVCGADMRGGKDEID